MLTPMSETLVFQILLIIHIIAGGTGLIAGAVNMVRRKGDRAHRVWGSAFIWGMWISASASLILATLNPNFFLFIVGWFTLYMVTTGYIFVQWPKAPDKRIHKLVGIILAVLMFVGGVILLYDATRFLLNSSLFGLVYLMLGVISLLFVRTDLTFYRKGVADGLAFQRFHLQRMSGGFIAALTAFLVVNANTIPGPIPLYIFWILPTLVITPFIIRWSRKYTIGHKIVIRR